MKSNPDVAVKLAEAQGYRATFNEAAERARAAGKADEDFIKGVDRSFANLEQQIQAATDEEVVDNLVDRAEELERLRAYVLPESEILLSARSCLNDMRDWGVPRTTIQLIESDLLPSAAHGKDLPTKRAALQKIFDFYDLWEHQATTYKDWIQDSSKLLGILLAGFLLAAMAFVLVGWGLYAFLAGGIAGSLASVLSRLPPMLGWGQLTALPARMYARIGLGIAGTLCGGGLMANGILTIGMDAQGFTAILAITHTATVGEGLYLAAIGILLGFTERLLSSLAGAFVKVSAEAPSRKPGPEEDT